jgi:hypothetical protein
MVFSVQLLLEAAMMTLAESPQGCSSKFPTWGDAGQLHRGGEADRRELAEPLGLGELADG